MTVPFDQRKLAILQVLEPSGGGSGRHFLDLCRGLAQKGHRVTAIYSPVRAEARFVEELLLLDLEAVHAVEIHRSPGPSDFHAWSEINRIARTTGPFDLIHAHSSKAGALTRIRPPGAAIPRVYTPHAFRTMDPGLGRVGRALYGSIEASLGRFSTDRIICVSADEESHARNLGIAAHKLRMIGNGANAPQQGSEKAMRMKLHLPLDALVFGFVGRLTRQKAPERLIEAFALVAADRPSAYLLMIGSGELEADLRRRIAATGLCDRIVLTDDFSGPQAMQCLDVLVMPSRYEAMPYVMLEAAAAAIPMILSAVGGVRTVVDDGRNGIIVPNADDPAHLADAMKTLADSTVRARYRFEAEIRRDRFSVVAMVDQTETLYREVLRERRHRGN